VCCSKSLTFLEPGPLLGIVVDSQSQRCFDDGDVRQKFINVVVQKGVNKKMNNRITKQDRVACSQQLRPSVFTKPFGCFGHTVTDRKPGWAFNLDFLAAL